MKWVEAKAAPKGRKSTSRPSTKYTPQGRGGAEGSAGVDRGGGHWPRLDASDSGANVEGEQRDACEPLIPQAQELSGCEGMGLGPRLPEMENSYACRHCYIGGACTWVHPREAFGKFNPAEEAGAPCVACQTIEQEVLDLEYGCEINPDYTDAILRSWIIPAGSMKYSICREREESIFHAVPAEAQQYWIDSSAQLREKAQNREFLCANCLLGDNVPEPSFKGWMHPAENFGVEEPSEVWSRIVQQGAWVRCLVCQSRANRRAIEEAILRGKDPPPELWFERQISRGEMLQLGGKLSDGTVGEGFRGVCNKLHYPFPGCLEFVPVFLICNVCLNKKCTACGGDLEMHRHRKAWEKQKGMCDALS